ncbi:MAG: sodium:proton antiporter [Polyangiaceae bacterium]|nr:sodium:proton antiporter [Polyangiaceae bacterium]
MVLFEWVVVLLCGAVVLAALARRIGAPYPAFLAVGGAAVALLPEGPRLALDPGLALALFVAPIVLDAAYDASVRDLRANWLHLVRLIVVVVTLTTLAVAALARTLRPSMPLSVAVVLGAVVAPPDASAAMAVMYQIRPPHRIRVILQGESLLNDVVALLIYRFAISASTRAAPSPMTAVAMGVLVLGGSVVAGAFLARLWIWLTARVRDVPSHIVLQFVSTFGIWMIAERVGLSPILTLVAYAISLARRGSAVMPARVRVPSSAVWDTSVFVLNVLAFVLIGLQIRPIFERMSQAARAQDLRFAAAVLATVIVVRLAWLIAIEAMTQVGHDSRAEPAEAAPGTRLKHIILVAWCGMRGIVTLAAALALPLEFPERDLIVLTAFAVVFGTLLIQGLTFRPLIHLLDVRDDHSVQREIHLGWTQGLSAALGSLDGDMSPAAIALRRDYEQALRQAAEVRDLPEPTAPPPLPSNAPRRRAIGAARAAISTLRSRGEIGDDAFHALEEHLDRVELMTDPELLGPDS